MIGHCGVRCQSARVRRPHRKLLKANNFKNTQLATSLSSSEALMDENDSGLLQFRGQGATECEEFMTAIVKRAFAQCKQRDDQWMADLAATCMVNDAMR